jgi:hypothetical protein
MNDDKNRKIESIFILFIILLGFYFSYLSLNTQMLGEDEASYYSLAKDFMNLEYNKDIYVVMPLTSLFYVPFFYVFGTSLGIAKAVISIFGILTLIFIYLFCKKIEPASFYGINVFGMASISVILTISYFTHFMLISYTEIPIAFFSILFTYLLLDFNTVKKATVVGIMMGLAIYVKATAFLLPVILFLLFLGNYVIKRDKDSLHSFKLVLLSCLIFVLILLPFVVRNLILFNFPFVEVLDLFFKIPPEFTSWGTAETLKTISLPINLYDVFGYIALFLSIFGIIYSFQTKNEKMILVTFIFLLFISVFFVRSFLGTAISDPRYFSFIFPQIAILGGYYLSKTFQWKRYLVSIVLVLFIFSVSISVAVALTTSQTQRYPSNYINALNWIRRNTNQEDIIFTAYGGSLKYYGERISVWSRMIEFPEVMTTSNSTRIYDVLKQYNISYVLVWRGILAENYIIPGSNINGAFTYNFLSQVDNDKEHFNLEYSNEDNFIYKLL